MSEESLVTSARQLLGTTYRHWRDHGLPATAKKAARILYHGRNHEPEPPVSAELLLRQRCAALTPLSTFHVPRPRPRLNLVLDRLTPDHLYGSAGTAVLLAALLSEKQGCDLRLLTRQERADEQAFAQLIRLAGVALPGHVEFRHLDCAAPATGIDLGSRELFLTTSWWTTSATLSAVAPGRVILLLQEDERLYYPSGDARLRCDELLRTPGLTCVVSSKLLFEHLRDSGLALAQPGGWFEPAFPSAVFFPRTTGSAASRFCYIARPRSPRHLFYLGITAIEQAIATGILNPQEWDFHFVGRDIPALRLAGQVAPQLHQDLAGGAFAALAGTVDLGLSLMHSPHPGYSTLALAASGAVVISNRCGVKQSLDSYSGNILCREPTVDELVTGLEQGVRQAKDRSRRLQGDLGILRDWRRALAPVLDSLAGRFA